MASDDIRPRRTDDDALVFWEPYFTERGYGISTNETLGTAGTGHIWGPEERLVYGLPRGPRDDALRVAYRTLFGTLPDDA